MPYPYLGLFGVGRWAAFGEIPHIHQPAARSPPLTTIVSRTATNLCYSWPT